ncbi:hypothetical protein C8F04DRAFT_1061804 [Mycena alexandri]|uniref:DUF4211 domain-containing protein n=1 Tax=Mycena alexandri TaxID=1745969 RepID=A0AAD6XBZ7_9AGAR|nr:hypothetical protein C8F04DRAFT_1061804 [Mycena alexandri]
MPDKGKKKKQTKTQPQTTSTNDRPVGGPKTNPSVAPPRPMRMEVLISMPAHFKRKRTPEPVEIAKDAKADIAPPKPKRRKVVEPSKKADETRKTKARKPLEPNSKESSPPLKRRVKRPQQILSSDDETCSGDEVESEHIIEDRLRARKPSVKDLALLKLKNKREKKPAPEPEAEESDDSESERDSLFDGSSSDDSVGSSDFIVEDDGSALALLPKQFRMEAHEGLSHQFKKIFQFMVHLAVRQQSQVRQAFMKDKLENDDYFSIPFSAARRRISSLRASLASQRWQPAFIANLEKYPKLIVNNLPSKSFMPVCDACRINGRQGCRMGTLGGTPYKAMGFRDTDVGAPEVQFYLGRFCSERVEVFHQLCHWEYELFQVVLAEVDQLREADQAAGILDDRGKFVPIKYIDRKEPPKDVNDADAIFDWLSNRALVDIEWAKIKELLKTAENVDSASKSGIKTD